MVPHPTPPLSPPKKKNKALLGGIIKEKTDEKTLQKRLSALFPGFSGG